MRAEIDLGAGQEQRQKLAFELRIAVGEAEQVIEIDHRSADWPTRAWWRAADGRSIAEADLRSRSAG